MQTVESSCEASFLSDFRVTCTFILCLKVRYVLENCKEDMDFFNTWIEKGIVDRLNV